MIKSFTREDARRVLSQRSDRCLDIPEGFTDTDGDFALLFDEDNSLYHFKSIHIPSTVSNFNGIFLTEYDPYMTEIKLFKEIAVSPENNHYCSVEGVLFSKDMKELLAVPAGKYLKVYNVPLGVERIADGAFSDNRFLEKIVLPDTIKYIGVQAFRQSENLREINLPEGLEFIGEESFMFAGDIHRLYIPDSMETMDGSNIASANAMIFPESLKTIKTGSVQTEYTGTYVAPVLLSHNNLVVEDFAETYGFNYFSDYVIDDDGIIWSPDHSVLIDFPKKWPEDTYIVPRNTRKVFRWAFNQADIKHVVFDHPIEIIGKSSGNDFSRLCSVEAYNFDKSFLIKTNPSEKMENDTTNNNVEYTFISYSTRNQAFADAMKDLLNSKGIKTWMAPGDIPVGSKYAHVINKALKECSCLLLILSNDAQNSVWVSKEVERAVNYRKPIFPVQIENIALNDEFELYISTDQVVAIQKIDENSDEIEKLLQSVRAVLKK